MRRSFLFGMTAAVVAFLAGPASAVPISFMSSSPTGTVKGVYETFVQEECQGSDGEYVLRVRGVEGTLASTAPAVSGPFEAEFVQLTNKATGDGVAFAFMGGINAWYDEWFAIAAFVADLPGLKGGMVGFTEYGDSLVANLTGKWKSGARLDMTFGGSSGMPNLGAEVLGDDCGILVFRSLSRMTSKLAPQVSAQAAAKLGRIGRQARAIAARPASTRISTASDFSIQLGSASNDGEYGTDVLDICPGDDTDYYYAGTEFLGDLSSSFGDFNGGMGGEALQFVRTDTDRGLALAMLEAGDGENFWEGFALGAVRGQKVRGLGLFLKDAEEPAMIIANMTGRFRDNGTYTLGFGDGSLALQDWTFGTVGTGCSVLPV
jgi:hypothetical protein